MLKHINHYRNQKDALEDLNRNFKATNVSATTYILSDLCRQATEKYLKNYNKERLTKGVSDSIRDDLIQRLQRRYGPWINVYDFQIDGRFHTNFDTTFRTDYGWIYGNFPGTVLDHLFFSTHCFDHFAERTQSISFSLLRLALKRLRKTIPTQADFLPILTLLADEFCETEEFIYVNIQVGILVIKKWQGALLVAVTYLSPEMNFPHRDWYRTNRKGQALNRIDQDPAEIKTPIRGPTFSTEELPYALYTKTIETQEKFLPKMKCEGCGRALGEWSYLECTRCGHPFCINCLRDIFRMIESHKIVPSISDFLNLVTDYEKKTEKKIFSVKEMLNDIELMDSFEKKLLEKEPTEVKFGPKISQLIIESNHKEAFFCVSCFDEFLIEDLSKIRGNNSRLLDCFSEIIKNKKLYKDSLLKRLVGSEPAFSYDRETISLFVNQLCVRYARELSL
jgi:hypothetical protein